MPAPEQYIPYYVRVLDRLKGIGIIIAVMVFLAYCLYFYYNPRQTAIYTGLAMAIPVLLWILIGQVVHLIQNRQSVPEMDFAPPPVAGITEEMRNISGVGGIISVQKFELGRRLILHYLKYNPLNKRNPADVAQIVKRSSQALNDGEIGLILDQLVSEEEIILESSGNLLLSNPGNVLNEDFVHNLFQYIIVLSETRFREIPEADQYQTIVQFITDKFRGKPVSEWTEIHSKILDEISEYVQVSNSVKKRETLIDSLA